MCYVISFDFDHNYDDILNKLKQSGLENKLKMIYVKPANPTNMIDLKMVNDVKKTIKKLVVNYICLRQYILGSNMAKSLEFGIIQLFPTKF